MKTVTNGKVKIAIIGAGRMAQLGYLPWIKGHPDAELAGVADVNQALLDSVTKRYKCPVYTSAEEMIEKSGADAVCITTPPWHHAEATVQAASRGMHVLCEKPMAPTVADCERMIKACDDNDVYLQIGFCLRFDPGFEKIKCMITENELGKIFQLRAIYDIWVPRIDAGPARQLLDAVNSLNILPKDFGAWRMDDPRTGGGVYNDHGLHYVDVFRWLLDEEVTHVTGVSNNVVEGRANEDHASSLLKFQGGAAAYIETSLCVLSRRLSDVEGMINGTSADLKFEMDEKWYILGIPYLYNVHAKVWKYDGKVSFLTNQWLPVQVKYGKKLNKNKRQMDWFISKINGTCKPHPIFGHRWAAEGSDGLISIKVNQSVYKSSAGEGVIGV